MDKTARRQARAEYAAVEADDPVKKATEKKDKKFWEAESKQLWNCYDIVKREAKQHKFPPFLLQELEEECHTLHAFFMSKSVPHYYSQKDATDLESAARDLGYDSNTGVNTWFTNRKKGKKQKVYNTLTVPLSKKRDKYKEEKACVKQFYKNKNHSRPLKMKKPHEKYIDVIAEVDGIETFFQVTHLLQEAVAVLFKGYSYSGECKTPEEIKNIIENALQKKQNKGGHDIILLLDAPYLLPDEKSVEAAVGMVSSNSPFKEIYIITPTRNFSVSTSL